MDGAGAYVHKDIAEVHGTLLATLAAVGALLRASPNPSAILSTLDGLAAHFETQVRRMADALPPAVAARYTAAFVETLEELRAAIPLH